MFFHLLFCCRIRDTTVKPRKEFTPKPRTSLDFSISENHNGGIHSARSPGGTQSSLAHCSETCPDTSPGTVNSRECLKSHTFLFRLTITSVDVFYFFLKESFLACFYSFLFPLTTLSLFLYCTILSQIKPKLMLVGEKKCM